jgi:hypothetical protein
MKTQVIAALLLAVCTSATTSTFASSRYPTPQGGATVSQRGEGSETSAVERPVVAFAQQSDTGLTRAQVRAELIQVEKAGYYPARISPHYPADIQAAMAKIWAADSATRGVSVARNADTGDGVVQAGSSTVPR